MKVGVGIPTYNRYDLLKPYIGKYGVDFPDWNIFIVDNGNQGIDISERTKSSISHIEKENDEIRWSKSGLIIIQNDKNVGVGASWNQLCKKIFEKNDYALILNDDIYLGKKQELIISLIEKKKSGFIRATPDWCAFLISKETFESVGDFDECFYPAYYEDKSYEYRMKLKGIIMLKHPDLNPQVYKSSQTLEKDPDIFEQSKKNKKLYIEMWGGEPTKETYKSRYDNDSRIF
jgi:GT2 family glycosyltransferase